MSAKQKGQFVINDISMSSHKEGQENLSNQKNLSNQENLSNTDMSKKKQFGGYKESQ